MENGRGTTVAGAARLWLIAGASFVVVALALWMVTQPSRKRAQARHDVAVLTFAMDKFAEEQGAYPKGSLGAIARQLRGDNPRRLDYVEVKPHEVNEVGEFVDPWGTPYRIEFAPTLLIYSCGPNRVDERGEGDDIVVGRP